MEIASCPMAHKIEDKERTEDVSIRSDVTFSSFALKPNIKNGLVRCGYINPSPIQLMSIPDALIGVDLVIQAKSGTGKTVVFAVTSLQTLQLPSASVQVLIITPTRELATQIVECIAQIGRVTEGLVVKSFIGGVDLQADKKSLKTCNVAVGTPGRIKQLLENNMLKPSSIRLLVLDEADKLMETPFNADINSIISHLPRKKQMIASSATYPAHLSNFLTKYMNSPKEIRLGSDDPSLIGVSQFHLITKSEDEKFSQVVDILNSIPFSQAMIFCNDRDVSKSLFELLTNKGHAIGCIHGEMPTRDRSRRMEEFKSKNLRALISTDLCSRGIDAENVDLVLNLDIPFGKSSLETYYHRIGRSGRFGSRGTAITILVENTQDAKRFFKLMRNNNLKISPYCGNIISPCSHSTEYPQYLEMLESRRNETRQVIFESTSRIRGESRVTNRPVPYLDFSKFIKPLEPNVSEEKLEPPFKKIKVESITEMDVETSDEPILHDQPPNTVAFKNVIDAVFPVEPFPEWKSKNLSTFVNFLNPNMGK